MSLRVKPAVESEKRIYGFRWEDLLGVAIMVIPFLISVFFFHFVPGRKILFVQISRDESISIKPNLISMLCSVVFYASLMVRYEGIFRVGNGFEVFISILRAGLNCWVIAALVTLIIPTAVSAKGSGLSVIFKNWEATMLLFALLFSWLGMKAIAGYSWILFIIAAWKRLLVVNNAMGMLGAVFILTLAISLFLQVRDRVAIQDFMRDFRGKANDYAGRMREEINAAAEDASMKAQTIGAFVEDAVSAYTGVCRAPSSAGAPRSDGVKIDLNALDLNRDGVVDEKDIQLIQKHAPLDD